MTMQVNAMGDERGKLCSQNDLEVCDPPASFIAHDEHILCLPDFMAEALKVVVSRGPTHTSLSRQPAHPPRTPPPCSHSGLAATCGGGHSFGLRRGLTRCSIAALCIKVPKEKETPRSAANAFRVLLPLLSVQGRTQARLLLLQQTYH